MAVLGAGIALAGLVILSGITAYHVAALPLPTGFREPESAALTIVDVEGAPFGFRGVSQGGTQALDDLPKHLVDAVIAFEDRRFFDHVGIDVRAILRAAFVNAMAGEVRQGGSTITQQLVKMEWLSPEPTFARKIQEAVLAIWLERRLTKQQILERYLNSVYLGGGAYGIAAAARRYFGKSPEDLNLAEAAMLVGAIQAPSRYAPTVSLETARRRAALVLAAMVEHGSIAAEHAARAKAIPAKLARTPVTSPAFGFAADWAAARTRAMLGSLGGDVHVATTIDARLQTLAHRTVSEWLSRAGETHAVTQAALIAMAADGRVLAMVGGRDHQASQFNRATQARRQPGSLFKLFVYLTALENGLHPESMIEDTPITIESWRPRNYSGRYHGATTLGEAFAKSYNAASVRLQERIGRDRIIALARSMGVRSPLSAYPSLALGAQEVSLLEMTAAFAAVRSHRAGIELRIVDFVRTDGGAVFRPPAEPPRAARWPQRPALTLLRRAVQSGTGRAAALEIPAYGKTGTSQDSRDAWFVGFAGDLVVGIWVGNDDRSPMKDVTGGGLPARMWRDFMTEALDRKTGLIARTPLESDGALELAALPEEDGASRRLLGKAAVVDTATLRIAGHVVRLEGVIGFGGRQARNLTNYIAQREVLCRPTKPDRYRCSVGGWDLSEVVLFNGGGRPLPAVDPTLRAAAREAQRTRRGIWRE